MKLLAKLVLTLTVLGLAAAPAAAQQRQYIPKLQVDDLETKAVNKVRYANEFATSGSGTLASPWVTTGSTPLQAAYDDLLDSGVRGNGVIRLLPGVYNCGTTRCLLVDAATSKTIAGLTIEGYSRGNQTGTGNTYVNDDATVLLYSGTDAAIKLGDFTSTGTTTAENFTVRNLKIRQTGTTGTGIGILGRLLRWSTIDNVTITDFSTGIALASVSDFNFIHRVFIVDPAAYGIDIGYDPAGTSPIGQCNGNTISKSTIHNVNRDSARTNWGIYIHNNSIGNVIRENNIGNFDTVGGSVSGYGAILVNDEDQQIIDANYFEGNYYATLWNAPDASDHYGLVFQNNYVTQIEKYGLAVNSASSGLLYGANITGNWFINPSASSPYDTAKGIYINTGGRQAYVAGNTYLNMPTPATDNFSVADANVTYVRADGGALHVQSGVTLGTTSTITAEGSTDDAIETILTFADPSSSDKTVTVPAITGTLVTTGDTGTVTGTMLTNDTVTLLDIDYTAAIGSDPALGVGETYFGAAGVIFEGGVADTTEGLLTVSVATTDKTWTLPNATGTVQLTGNSTHGGTLMWGDSDDATDSGIEVCALAGLTCVDVQSPDGVDSDCASDQGTAGTYFYALCR